MKFKDRFKLWFKDFDIKLEVFLGLILKMPWKKLALVISIVLVGLGALIGVGYFLYWGLPKLGSLIWSGIITVFGWIGALLHFIVVDLWVMLWSLYWNWGVWDLIKSDGDTHGILPFIAKGLGIVMFAALLFLWLIPTIIQRRREKKAEKKTKKKDSETDAPQDKSRKAISRQNKTGWLFSPFVFVPEQHTVWIYWTLFGFAIGSVSKIKDSTCLKWPFIQIAILKTREERDRTIESPQLPVRTSPSVLAGLKAGERESEEARAQIAAGRGKKQIGATLSYKFRMTVGLRTGDGPRDIRWWRFWSRFRGINPGGQWPLVKASPAYSDIDSQEVFERLTFYVTTRLRDVLKHMDWEDAYELNGKAFFIGTAAQAADVDKYEELLQSEDFKIDLRDDAAVARVVKNRSDSLLATLWNFGYRVPFFEAEDPNATTKVQAAQEDKTVAEHQRDAQATRWVSQITDKARAEADGRTIHARVTRENFLEVASALVEEIPDEIDSIKDQAVRARERFQFISQKVREAFPPQQRLAAQQFLEKMRTKVRIAEAAKNFTYIDSDKDTDLMSSIIAGTSAAVPYRPPTNQKDDTSPNKTS